MKARDQEPLTLESLYVLFRRVLKWALVIGIGFLVGIGVLLLALQRATGEAQSSADQAQEAIDLVVAQRDEARMAACVSFNEDLADNVNALNDYVQDLLTRSASGEGRATPRTDAEQARADEIISGELQKLADIKVVYRVCTPEAIAEFYALKAGT